MTIRVFVYGSLKSGVNGWAHDMMRGAKFLGDFHTEPGFKLIEIGELLAMVKGGHKVVYGEVYEVSPILLTRLDVFEGNPRLYLRVPIVVCNAVMGNLEVQAYLWNRKEE